MGVWDLLAARPRLVIAGLTVTPGRLSARMR
jgi:hypothetical protein